MRGAHVGFKIKPTIAGGGLLFTDNFNRADLNNLGANWFEDGYSIVSNQCSRDGSGGDFGVYVTTLGTPDHWAEFVLPSSSSSFQVVNARRPANNDNTFAATGYLFFVNPGSPYTPTVGKVSGGSYQDVAFGTALGAWPGAVQLRIEVQGTTIRGYVNNSLSVTTTDTDITTGNFAGINLGAGTIDNWRTGTLPWTP